MIRTDCLKCGASIPAYESEYINITSCLCENCWKIWRKFHHKYGDAIKKKYPLGKNNHHGAWAVFLGELPNLWDKSIDKLGQEKVQFT